jgi:hypothetical protein
MTEHNHKELRAKWTAALRSGEYEQGKKDLCTPDGAYCCLGVAGKVIGLSDYELRDIRNMSVNPYALVAKTFGLRDVLGEYSTNALFRHNDVEGLTFAQIADIIDAEPEGLFVD